MTDHELLAEAWHALNMTIAEVDQLRAEVAELRDGAERFRGKLMREFVALVDEYRGIDAIRAKSKGQG